MIISEIIRCERNYLIKKWLQVVINLYLSNKLVKKSKIIGFAIKIAYSEKHILKNHYWTLILEYINIEN